MSDQPVMESYSVEQAAEAMDGIFSDEPVVGEITEEAVEADELVETSESEETATEESSEELEETGEDVDEEPIKVESEQEAIETLTELSEALDVPIEELMSNMTTTVKVDGEEHSVTLKEAFDGYQKDADYRNKTSELASHRREFNEQTANARQRIESEYIQAGQLMAALEQSIAPSLDPAEMENLKAQDPATYLIAKQEHADRVAQFNQLRQTAANSFAQNSKAMEQQQAQLRQESIQRAMIELPQRIPEWSPETKSAIDDYLTSDAYGYSGEDLSKIVDVRLVELAHKARLYDEQSKQVDIAKKKVKVLPRIQKPGRSSSVRPGKNMDKARAKLQQSGRYQDAASLINVD